MENIYGGMTQQYKLSKTLRFELKPIGSTMDNIRMEGFLEKDKKRSEDYKSVKKLMDDYHRWFIEKSLSNCVLDGLEEYYSLYTSSSRNDEINAEISKLNAKYRAIISKWFESQEEYKGLFKIDFVSKLLPVFLESHYYTKEDKAHVKNFDKFSTYFIGFYENRKNVYSCEEISTAIPFRIINDNLPIFIEDVQTFKKYEKVIKKIVDESKYTDLTTNLLESMFTIESFNRVLSQNGIDSFNRMLGGYSLKDGTKMQGLNELINLFNQKVEKFERLPLFVNLKKQILSDVDINGFVLDSFDTDIEMMNSLKDYYETITNSCFNGDLDARKLFNSLNDYDLSKIYVENNMTLTGLSNEVYGGWDIIKQAFYEEYRNQIKDDYETFNEWYKKQDCFSLEQIVFVLRQYSPYNGKNILDKLTSFSVNEVNLFDKFANTYKLLTPLFTIASENKRFVKETEAIRLIKEFLDSAKEIQRFLSLTQVRASDIEKDSRFYNALLELDSKMSLTNDIYNKIRNYLTQKPYSQEKFKLNFERPTLLKGWDLNKEKDNLSVILKRNGMFYLGIMNRNNSKMFLDVEETSDDFYEKMEYKLLPGPNKMLPKLYFSKKGLDIYQPSEYILQGYKAGKHKKENLDVTYMQDLIDFYKDSLKISHPMFDFQFKESSEYKDISEFYNEVEQQGYTITFKKISAKWIDQMVYENKLYLFQIYNKDYSSYSKGKKNLHTLYWEGIFSEKNRENIIYKLDGEAELFYRPASLSLSQTTIHVAEEEIQNKNINNEKKSSVFEYDIIKDRRYTEDKFMFHVPMSFNFINKRKTNLNELINRNIKYSENVNVIGIDRGERNLLYVSVIDQKGKILEQHSLNEIVTNYNRNSYKVDYHGLLDRKEKEREAARESWQTVNNIKELKEGYISIVINKIVQLMDKYHAIIVLEDLDHGFKNSRVKVEKQVYQKFEKALIEKLNFLVLKDKKDEEMGSIYHPYQLTNKFESFTKLGKQTGVLFYIPAQNTSKIDPSTGFINKLYPKYESIMKSQEFFRKFNDIRFNENKNYFEFVLDYRKFIKGFKTKPDWTICTYGIRLVNQRNPHKNNMWDTFEHDLTNELKELFEEYRIDYCTHLQKQIVEMNDKAFFERLLQILKWTLQMRNSRTGSMEDSIISPVVDEKGKIFVSGKDDNMPLDADANGAYNIARKGLICVQKIKETEDDKLGKMKYKISLDDFLDFVQNHE